jgi:GLPGLI family protein
MKKYFSILLLCLAAYNLSAQDFQGMAVYESKTSTSDIKSRFEGNKDITPDMRKMIEDRMKQVFEKTFVLNFDKSNSIYKEEEKLEAPGQGQGGMRMISAMMGGGGTFYKNIKDKTYIVDKEFMGKEFLIKDTLSNLKWKMESETKQIGGYNCFKATAVRAASKTDFRNFRPKDEKGGDKKEATKTEGKEKTTSIMEEFEMPENTTITAWYTPEIPVSHGPENYWGLPGLILEANDGKTTILCSKVVLNPKDKAAIKAPTNGKVISQADYDETVTKKMEELRQMNQGNNGGFRMPMGQ